MTRHRRDFRGGIFRGQTKLRFYPERSEDFFRHRGLVDDLIEADFTLVDIAGMALILAGVIIVSLKDLISAKRLDRRSSTATGDEKATSEGK